ncbi:MAG: hypothetical protein BWY50_01718 [Spirochaetes bacterium ADurb.Bin315]|jgi:hypothetical protein|nr:hypothetical protein [Spirochaetales bacterium]OQA41771.1 MAG: hypothetical protein BWY50_01718 [Spirochaetes bacterium ADurb.Bin315]
MDFITAVQVLNGYLESIGIDLFGTVVVAVVAIGTIRRVIFGIACAAIAKSKGYRHGFWWGFLLPLLGLLVVALRPQKVVTVRMGPTYPFTAE